MNKLAKGLLFALAIATPVAISAPIFQAEAATVHTTHHVATNKANGGKAVKHKHHKHHAKRHTSSAVTKK
ncbi:hypothetical protein BV372_15140 [Nostoc sp. T09]|uniref:hypothetical protein n=1 Tax=Nostoc sp. T09 TaxID=1932621 RepID=UPI000A36B9A4|nr:hypothetical protein [Nostoc sp. T09]OUL33854.1 hypothetical protein BV372_15140 [Nostoc sp. T09]